MKRVMTRWKRAGAFTLIEMLTVIAIIGILAALLLPAIRLAMRKAKEAVARADIAGLTTALSQYSSDFGALPPDRTNDNEPNAAGDLTGSEANFGDADSPNECLVWFLTREYVTNADGAGRPWATGSGWNPDASTTVFARASGGPYFSMKAKQTKDYDQDGYPEFVDPWGRPYLYRAYPHWYSVSSASASGSTLTVTLTNPGDPDLGNLAGIQGYISLRGFDTNALNVTRVKFLGSGSNTVKIEFKSSVGATTGTTRQFSFPLHNPRKGDVYSLGVRGTTRGNQRPLNAGGSVWEWKPFRNTASFNEWQEVWGTPGDGNDTKTSDSSNLTEEKYRDDLNNW